MPQYGVTVYRKVVSEQVAEVKIEARSEAEAKLIAAECAETESALGDSSILWKGHHSDTFVYRVEVHEPASDDAA